MASSTLFSERLVTFKKALAGFASSLQIDLNQFDASLEEIVRNGQVQKFEYCSELLWKTLKQYLYDIEGIDETSPKSVIKAFYVNANIPDSLYHALIEMINDRNQLSHVYSEEKFNLLYSHLPAHATAMKQVMTILDA